MVLNQTTCFYTIKLVENNFNHQKDISTEVSIPDFNYKQGPFGNDLN